MSYTEAIISGIVQGLTEFLPVSSSGHLVILHHFFGYNQPQFTFDIFLHIGTLFAVLVYFRRDIIDMLKRRPRLFMYVILATIPTALIGFLFIDFVEGLFQNIKLVGLMLFVTAGFLFIADKVSTSKSNTGKLSWVKAIGIGVIQGLAIAPGISRSGSTISSGILFGLDKNEAIRFSFLLAIPAILGALILQIVRTGGRVVLTSQMLIGSSLAFVVGLVSIYILIKSVINAKLKYFAIYCILVGGVLLIL